MAISPETERPEPRTLWHDDPPMTPEHFHHNPINGRTVLVTGACGTVGSELVRQLLTDHAPAELIGLDNHEESLFFLDQRWLVHPNARFSVTDLRDRDSLIRHMSGVDLVFHCAAMKHVILCERDPEQAILTNIVGVQNVILAAQTAGVKQVLFTSSDKAVNPTNVMGTSKLMGERLMTAANSNQRHHNTCFSSTRFGNVLGSSGSVIRIFYNQIARGGPVTLTHPDMSRFVMTIRQAVAMLIESVKLMRGGEVFVTKMPVMRIRDLADAMIAELAPRHGWPVERIAINEIGVKPGEKLYEELMSEEETRRTVELPHFFAILPAFRGIYGEIDYQYPGLIERAVSRAYVSAEQSSLSVEAIRDLLTANHLFDPPQEQSSQRYWPGDKETHLPSES